MHQRNLVPRQQFGRPHARELQQLRRLNGAGAEYHFMRRPRLLLPLGGDKLYADRPLAFKQHPRRPRFGDHPQIGAFFRRAQIADCGAAAPAVARVYMEIADSLLALGVEIIVARMAGLLGRFDEGVAQLVRLGQAPDGERPAHAVESVRAVLEVFRFLEIGQHLGVSPAAVAQTRPALEILALTAYVDQTVDRARSAQALTPRLDDAPVIELGFGLALEHPVVARIGEQLAIAQRYMDPGIGIAQSRLEQQFGRASRWG